MAWPAMPVYGPPALAVGGRFAGAVTMTVADAVRST
jgi:hypothetical protein